MAADTFYWRGNGAGTKTAWNDGRNWVNSSGVAFLPAVYPGTTAGDTAVFDAALSAGASSPAGYDGSADYMCHLKVGPDYDGTIGSASDYVQMDFGLATVTLMARDAGAIYLDNLNVSDSGVFHLHDGAAVYLKGTGTMGWTCYLYKGTVTLDTPIAYLQTSYKTNPSGDVQCTILSTASFISSYGVTIGGGQISCAAAIDQTLTISAGRWTHTGGNISGSLTIAGGTLDWRSGNITEPCVITAGVLDASQSSTARTLDTVTLYPAGTLNVDNGLGTITLESGKKVVYRGGTLKLPAGTQVSW